MRKAPPPRRLSCAASFPGILPRSFVECWKGRTTLNPADISTARDGQAATGRLPGFALRLPVRLTHAHLAAATLGLIVLAGIAVRVWLMARANWMIDGDEATFGLMARHIQEGERPIFLYGQPYMGTLQAYLGAISFSLFGMSRLTLKLVTIPEFIAFAASLFLLARRIAGARVALLATLLAAIPPLYVVQATARLWGPLLDTMTLGNLILLLAIDEAYGEAPPRRPWLRFLAIGLLGGVGFWLHGQIVIYLATAALLLVLANPRVLIQPRLVAALGGFVAGAAPVFEFARTHDYTTFHYLLGVGVERSSHNYVKIAWFYVRENLPHALGLSEPWTPSGWWYILPVTAVIGGCLLAFAWRRRAGFLGWLRLSLRDGRPEDALALFAILLSLAFIFSSFGDLALRYRSFDATGRYAVPLASVVPIIVAIELVRLGRRRLVVAAGATLVLIGCTLGSYALAPPTKVWQSAYWAQLPPSSTALIAALDDLGVDAVWMNHWAGTPLMFDTQERIAAADYYDLAVGNGIDRLPAASQRVNAAPLPAFVFVTDTDDVPLEAWLQEHGIAYDKRVVPHYVVIHPHQHVDPAEVVDLLGIDA